MKTVLIGFLFLIAACSSTPKNTQGQDIEADRTLSRIDDMSSRPSWLKESQPFSVVSGEVSSLGQTQIPGDNRVEAAYRIAESNAKEQIAKAIEQRLDYVFQNAEEGTSIDSTQARFIGAEAANLTTSSVRVDKRYWEKVLVSDENGQKRIVYKVFATVKMPETDFKRAILDAIRKQQGKGGLSKDFAQKVDQHWDKFVNAPATDATPKQNQ